MQLFVILYSVIGLLSLLLILVFIKTPAMPFLMASLLKKKIMYIIGKDKSGVFRTFTSRFGSGVVKGEGLFNLTENSHTLEQKTKTPIYFSFRDCGATQDLVYPAMLQELREHFNLNNVDDLQNLIDTVKQGVDKKFDISIQPYKTYSIADMENMFPFNLDPTFIDSQVQGELTRALKLKNATPMIITGLVALFIAGGLAVYLVTTAFKGNISEQQCTEMIKLATRAAPVISETVKTVAYNATAALG